MSQIADAIEVAVDGVVIVAVIALAGIISTRIKVNLNQCLTPEGCSDISKTTVNIFLPALLFTEILSNLSISQLENFALLFGYCTLHVAIGLVLGYLLSIVSKATIN